MNNSKLAHNWANKIKENGKGSSMFYYGDTIYSYGYHFKIAKFVTINDHEFIAFNSNSYSNSTSKHQNHVRYSIPSNYDVIKCPNLDFGYYGNLENIKYYINNINEYLSKSKKANKYKEFQLNQSQNYLDNFIKYIRLFKININEFNNDIIINIDSLQTSINDYLNSNELKLWKEKQKVNEINNAKNELIKQAENIEKFRSFKINHVYSLPYNLLRYNIDKNLIETSGGVSIDKNIFIKYYNKLKSNSLIIDEKIEFYRYGGIVDNIVFVGCHKFELNEIESLINNFNN